MGKAAWIRGVAAGIAGLIALWGAWQLSRDPTPQERRTDLREWVRETEAACTTAFTSIASRGMAIDIVDLDRVVVRADHDLRRAFGRIRRLDDPKGSRMRVGAVHAAMTQVERDVSAIARASEDADRPALRRLAPSFRDHAQDFVNATADAGARECAPLGLPSLAADAVLGPVFAQDFAAFDEEYGRRLRAIFTGGDPTRKQVAGRFARAATVLRDAERDYAELAVPAVAADAARRYEAQLGRLRRQAAQLRRLLAQDDPADDPRVLRLLREYGRQADQLVATGRRTLRAARAEPIGDPQAEPTADSGEQPA